MNPVVTISGGGIIGNYISSRLSKNDCFVIRTKETFGDFNKMDINPKKSYMNSIESNKVLDLIIENKLL